MAQTLTIRCIKPGGGTFLVDGGRPGYRHLGVAAGGPADVRAMRRGNQLLDRQPDATCLEFTQTGGHWLVSGSGQFVLVGADMNWRLNGRLIEAYQVQYLDGDGLLTSTPAKRGVRSYLCINGKWQLPHVLGSVERGLPGTQSIKTGWEAAINWAQEADFHMDLEVHQHYPEEPLVIPVSEGPEWSLLSSTQKDWLLQAAFMVHPDSNRQGISMLIDEVPGPTLPALISSPVLPGTVQLTPSGPILLGPDAQTIGGYPRVLLAANQDVMGAVFQVGIGGTVTFSLR